MRKKTLSALIIVIICLIGAVAVYFLWLKGVGTKEGDKISKGLFGKPEKKEYLILYGKSSNDVYTQSIGDKGCKQFTLHEYLGGGTVKSGGSENESLKVEGYPIGYPDSKKYDNYYYISASSSPVKEMRGIFAFDWDFDEQKIWSADFKDKKSKEIKSSNENKFPGGVLVSPDNKYLVHLMTDKKERKFEGGINDPFLSDSDLIIRNIKSGEEHIVLNGNYNRRLFYSFSDFSKDEDAFYTIAKDGESFKFIKVMLDSGEVIDFDKAFPEFDWTKINWDDFFKREDYSSQPAFFFLSKDETRLVAYKNTMRLTLEDFCLPTGTHNLWLFNLQEDTVDTYPGESGLIVDLDWKKDSQSFAFVLVSAGGCYPDYIDSMLYKMDKDAKNKENLVTQKKSKMNTLGWSPDGKEIVYSIYADDFIGRIKSVNPETKVVREIINTKETEGSINKERPVTLHFIEWVEK